MTQQFRLDYALGQGAWKDGPILSRHWQEVDKDLGDENGVLITDGSQQFPEVGYEGPIKPGEGGKASQQSRTKWRMWVFMRGCAPCFLDAGQAKADAGA